MDKREFNNRLNGLKDAYPNDLALIEGIQDLFNKKIEVISDSNAHALLYNPVQFMNPIKTSNGEWTTQLHIWADNMIPQLLQLDPRILVAKDSYGNTVLHSMVMAATGKFTQMVDYDYIQEMLDKNMSYMYLSIPNDPASKTEGNAWLEKDPFGKTAMDYLIDIANGEETGMSDAHLGDMLANFSQSGDAEMPVDTTPEMPVDNMIDPVTGQPIQGQPGEMQPDGQQMPGQDSSGPATQPGAPENEEATSMDRTTEMKNPDPETGDPGTPEIEKATDTQQDQIDQAHEELQKQPNPMLETLARLFH